MELPTDKLDLETANKLLDIPPDKLEPYIPKLLEWLQDYNWPVAKPVSRALAQCGYRLVEPIRLILEGDDDIWKYYIARFLLLVDSKVRLALAEELARIVNTPTSGEVAEEVDLVMKEVLFLMADIADEEDQFN